MIVYKITNKLDGKPYIGQTCGTPQERFLEHKRANSPIGKAIRQFGVENFTIEIVDECETAEQARELEKFFIIEYDSMTPNGYNQVGGGVRRDARINLAFTTELKKQLEDIASVDEISMNALVEKICVAYVQCRAEDLSELESFRARIREKNSVASLDEPAKK